MPTRRNIIEACRAYLLRYKDASLAYLLCLQHFHFPHSSTTLQALLAWRGYTSQTWTIKTCDHCLNGLIVIER